MRLKTGLSKEQKQFLWRFPPLFVIPYAVMRFIPLDFLTRPIAFLESFALNAFGFQTQVFGSTILSQKTVFTIIPDCSGLVMVILFLALYYSTKTRRYSIKENEPAALAPYVLFLLAFNLLRLFVTLAVGLSYGGNALDKTHMALWFVDSAVVMLAWAHAQKRI